MSPIWIKICGITRAEDAHAAAALGVDAIGLVFYPPSPRAVTAAVAREVLADMQGIPEIFALFVDPRRDEVEAALAVPGINHLQFHGQETPEFCESFGVPYMKAFRVQATVEGVAATVAGIGNHPSAKYFLLDSYEKNVPGGTGKTFDWSCAADIVAQCDQKIILAGGLHADNVTGALETVRPFGVDVSSGVEASAGIKQLDKMESFVEGVRSVRY